MKLSQLSSFQRLLYVEKQKGFVWTNRRLERGTNIEYSEIKKIRSGHLLPTFAQGLAILNLIFGDLDRPSVRSVWPKMRKAKKSNKITV